MLHVSTLRRFRSFPAPLPPLFALWEGSAGQPHESAPCQGEHARTVWSDMQVVRHCAGDTERKRRERLPRF